MAPGCVVERHPGQVARFAHPWPAGQSGAKSRPVNCFPPIRHPARRARGLLRRSRSSPVPVAGAGALVGSCVQRRRARAASPLCRRRAGCCPGRRSRPSPSPAPARPRPRPGFGLRSPPRKLEMTSSCSAAAPAPPTPVPSPPEASASASSASDRWPAARLGRLGRPSPAAPGSTTLAASSSKQHRLGRRPQPAPAPLRRLGSASPLSARDRRRQPPTLQRRLSPGERISNLPGGTTARLDHDASAATLMSQKRCRWCRTCHRVALNQHGVALDQVALPPQLAKSARDGAPGLGVALPSREQLGQVAAATRRALAGIKSDQLGIGSPPPWTGPCA